MSVEQESSKIHPLWRFAPVAFLVGLGILLTSLGVNQSSVGMYKEGTAQSFGWGVDRPIRSDEWLVRLPWLVGQASLHFPAEMRTAGIHDPSITYDLPVRSLQMVLKPHLLPYLLLDINRAVSAEWWFLVLGCIAAVYVLLITLGTRPTIAAAIGVLVGSSPGLHWWTVSSSFSIVIYSCLGAAAMLVAMRSISQARWMILAVLAGWMFACSTLVLYPPFQVPTMVAVGLVLLLVAHDRWQSTSWPRVIQPILAAGVVFVICICWFVLSHRSGLHSMAATVYPGMRRSSGGGVNVQSLLGAPFDLKASSIVAGSVNQTNQSENSSTFMVAGVVLLLFPGMASIRHSGLPGRLLLVAGGWLALLVSWMLLPLPAVVGRLTLLDRVPPDRLKPSVAFVAALVLALFLEHFSSETPAVRRVTALLSFGVVTIWAGSKYLVNDLPLSRSAVWGFSALWLVPASMMFTRFRRSGVVALAVVSVFTSAHINPLHRSVDPIRSNRLFDAVLKVDPLRSGTWVTFTGSAQVRGVMVAAGLQVESAVSPYPDPAFWARFDPTGTYADSWNRYAHVNMVLGSGRTTISSPQSDVVQIVVDPCAVGSPISRGTYFVESTREAIPCVDLVSTAEYQGVTWYLLRKD